MADTGHLLLSILRWPSISCFLILSMRGNIVYIWSDFSSNQTILKGKWSEEIKRVVKFEIWRDLLPVPKTRSSVYQFLTYGSNCPFSMFTAVYWTVNPNNCSTWQSMEQIMDWERSGMEFAFVSCHMLLLETNPQAWRVDNDKNAHFIPSDMMRFLILAQYQLL